MITKYIYHIHFFKGIFLWEQWKKKKQKHKHLYLKAGIISIAFKRFHWQDYHHPVLGTWERNLGQVTSDDPKGFWRNKRRNLSKSWISDLSAIFEGLVLGLWHGLISQSTICRKNGCDECFITRCLSIMLLNIYWHWIACDIFEG